MVEYELSCIYDTRQSFYGKAKVKEIHEIQDLMEYTTLELYSYGTLVAVATINEETCITTYELMPYKTLNGRTGTQTTTRHIKEFLKQNGLNDKEIKELFKKRVL